MTQTNYRNEQALLSILLRDSTLLDDVGNISGQDFVSTSYGAMYEALKLIVEAGNTPDVVSVAEKILPVEPDAFSMVYQIYDYAVSMENFGLYLAQFRADARLRKFKNIFRKMGERLMKPEVEGDELLHEVLQELTMLTETGETHIDNRQQLATAWLAEWEKRQTQTDGLAGISTGYKELDKLTNGWQKGQLIVIGARPGNGKTTLAMNMARTEAYKGGSVAFFTLEISTLALYEMFLSDAADVLREKMLKGTINEQEWAQIETQIKRLPNTNLFIVEQATLATLAANCRLIKRKYGLSLIVIDYLQLLQYGKHEYAHLILGEITRTLKRLAMRLEVPIVLLSQLNRDIDKRPDAVPKLSDLRQSGNIEQDADVVMFINNAHEDAEDPELRNAALLIVEKNRSGKTGDVVVHFHGAKARFENSTLTYERYKELVARQKKSDSGKNVIEYDL